MVRLAIGLLLLLLLAATSQARPLQVDVTDYGAVCNKANDDTAAIQAAIDWAATNNVGEVRLPDNCLVSAPIYLDPPGNLRSNLANPTNFSFSLSLVGAAGPGSGTGTVRLWATFNNNCVLWVGPGQGMAVKGVAVSGPPVGRLGFRRGLPSAGAGVCVAGGNGGASRTLIENVSSNLLYSGIIVGANGNPNLGDSTTIRKCNITGAVGINFTQTNNLINRIDDCVISANQPVIAASWNGVNITGGNFSSPGLSGNVFTLSGISVSAAQQGQAQTAYAVTVTATVTNPDIFLPAGVYDGFAIVTQHFGVVPLQMQSYNAATNVVTFLVLNEYSSVYFAGWGNNPAVNTNLAGEIAGAGTLYAAERAITLQGLEIHVTGLHVENGNVPTTLLDGYFGTNGEGGAHNSLRDIRINGDLTDSRIGPSVVGGTASPALQAQFYVSRSWPQLRIGYSETLVENLTMDHSNERFIVDCFNPQCRMVWRGSGPKVQFRVPIAAYPFTGGTVDGLIYPGVAPALGAGEFDADPFYASSIPSWADTWRGPWGQGRSPMWGVRPAPWASPTITAGQLATLQGTLPPLSLPPTGAAVANYPLLWGGQVYRLADWHLTAQPYQLTSSHHFYSYGQALPVSWSHMGQSAFLYLSDSRLMFPGLGIGIDNGDGSGPQLYMVTGVYPTMGYVTVLKAVESRNGPWLMLGAKAQVYRGSSIGQEAYSITRF